MMAFAYAIELRSIRYIYPENHKFNMILVDLATRMRYYTWGNSQASDVGVGTETSRTVVGVNSG